jgi:S-formylglutathione hydrolase FrmB
LAAIPLCVLAGTLVLNVWVGYVQTITGAWNHLTEGPLPDEMDFEAAFAQAKAGHVPATGAVIRIDSGQANSGFRHRGELVYLPPIWFQLNRPPLPMVVMIGGSMGTSSDWVRAGAAASTADAFAKEHGGSAPILAFPDVNGAFNNDTECVNGDRGNAADHIIKDFVPYVSSTFGVGSDRDSRAIAGWSMGGTCAVMLTTLHPEMFSAFMDMDGDLGPNSGNRQQTIDRLYGGHADEWKRVDPMSILKQNGDYSSVSGYFAVEGDGSSSYTLTPELPQGFISPTAHVEAARALCALGRANGMTCAVVVHPGKHDWQFAAEVFKVALPWLAGELGVPTVEKVPLPTD